MVASVVVAIAGSVRIDRSVPGETSIIPLSLDGRAGKQEWNGIHRIDAVIYVMRGWRRRVGLRAGSPAVRLREQRAHDRKDDYDQTN